jgi:hypothetical protein
MVFAGRGGLNAGGFASGVAAAYAGSRMAAAPAQSGSSWILGAYAGLGGGFTFTNATNVQQLSGPFATTSVSLPFASGSLSQGGGIWQLSVTFGPGAIAAATQTTSNTATTKVYGHC